MTEKISIFSRETLIPISLCVLLFSGVWFLAKLDYRVSDNRADIIMLQNQMTEMQATLRSIENNVNIMTGIMQKQIEE